MVCFLFLFSLFFPPQPFFNCFAFSSFSLLLFSLFFFCSPYFLLFLLIKMPSEKYKRSSFRHAAKSFFGNFSAVSPYPFGKSKWTHRLGGWGRDRNSYAGHRIQMAHLLFLFLLFFFFLPGLSLSPNTFTLLEDGYGYFLIFHSLL